MNTIKPWLIYLSIASFCLLSACHQSTAYNQPSQKKRVNNQNWQSATQEIISQYGQFAEKKLIPAFHKAKMPYPPDGIALLAFKHERKVELWAKKDNFPWKYIKTYALTANSGLPGPKLRQYDKQIPEGIYRITSLNPFSSYHLSMKLDYPNAFDRHFAKLDGRQKLGGNIFIHGKALSVGCLAIGDLAIEELFVLTGKVGKNNTLVIIAPNDLRKKAARKHPVKQKVTWLSQLDGQLTSALTPFKHSRFM